ncbi:DUF2637 domain-containing protein, partial [Streptomyces sp. NPDC048604]
LAYRRKIASALERIAREQAVAVERSRVAEQARREQEKAERLEAEERSRREQERDREHAEQLERERLEREAQERREQREHALALEQQRAEREAQQRREEREERERVRLEEQRRANREQAQRLELEQQARAERERVAAARAARREHASAAPMNTGTNGVNTAARTVNAEQQPTPAAPPVKLDEQAAREHIAAAVNADAGVTVRALADETGWSIGWVSTRRQELQRGTER